jgi:hypothetical protein
MAEIGSRVYIDSWNYFQLNGSEIEVDTANNRSKVAVWLDLHVAGHVAASGISVGVNEKSESLGYQYYGAGAYRLIYNEIWVGHNDDGSGTAILSWWFNSGIGSWSGSGALGLTKIQRSATITSFTGTSISNAFRATYNGVSGATEYKLRISIPHVVALQTFSNYSSGANVYLSSSAIEEIRRRTTSDNVQLGGVIETYKNGSKVGESSEIIINAKINKNVHIAVNGQYREATSYVGVNGQWKEAIPYIRINGQWKEGI